MPVEYLVLKNINIVTSVISVYYSFSFYYTYTLNMFKLILWFTLRMKITNLTIKQNKKFKMPTQKNPKTEQKKMVYYRFNSGSSMYNFLFMLINLC